MTVIASTLVPAQTPAAKGDLWIPPALFLHDWGGGGGAGRGLVLRTAWTTELATVHSAGEARAGLTPKPSRSIDVNYLAMTQAESVMLRSLLHRMAMARTPVPLFCDQSILTASVMAAATAFHCETSCRRFFPGARIVIWDEAASSMTTTFEFATIDSVVVGGTGGGTIHLTAGLTRGYTHAMAAPVIECDLVPQTSATYLTDGMLGAQLTFRETVGAMTLDPIVAVGDIPENVTTYDGLPVFAIAADWGGVAGTPAGGALRVNETTQVGLVNYTEVHGSRFKATQSVPCLQLDRASAWAVAGFFDSRGGRQKVFLAADLTSDYLPAGTITTGSATVDLVAIGPAIDWTWRTHLALVLADDTLVVRGITSVDRSDGVDTVTLDSILPDLSPGVVRIAAAFQARFDIDEIQETWLTDTVLQVQLPQMEALRETTGDDEEFDFANPLAVPAGGGVGAADPQGRHCIEQWAYNCTDASVTLASLFCLDPSTLPVGAGIWTWNGEKYLHYIIQATSCDTPGGCEPGDPPAAPGDTTHCPDCTEVSCITIRDGQEEAFRIGSNDQLRIVWNTRYTCVTITDAPTSGTIVLDFDSFPVYGAIFKKTVGNITYTALVTYSGNVGFSLQNDVTLANVAFDAAAVMGVGASDAADGLAACDCGDVAQVYDPPRDFPGVVMSGPTGAASGSSEGVGGSISSDIPCVGDSIIQLSHYPMGDVSAALLSKGCC